MTTALTYKTLQLQPRTNSIQAVLSPVVVYDTNSFEYEPRLWTSLLPPPGVDPSETDSVQASPLDEQRIAFNKGGDLINGISGEEQFVWVLN